MKYSSAITSVHQVCIKIKLKQYIIATNFHDIAILSIDLSITVDVQLYHYVKYDLTLL